MGCVLSVISLKGGSSKTAIVTVVAANLAHRGYRVAVVDADPSGHFAAWFRIAEQTGFACTVESRGTQIAGHALVQAARHDVTIVDTGSQSTDATARVVAISDFVLVPIHPDRASVTAAIMTSRHILAVAGASQRQIPYRIVKSRWNPRGIVERTLGSELARHDLIALEQHLSQSSEFGKLSMTGIVPTKGRVALQVGSLIEELVGLGAVPVLVQEGPDARVRTQAN